MTVPRKSQLRRRSFEWVAGFAALVIAIAVIAGLLYSRDAQGTRQDAAGQLRPASNVKLMKPTGIAIAPGGSIYFTDQASGFVFRILPDGTLVTVAGRRESATSEEASADDGHPALGAYLYGAAGVTFDRSGNLYIADRDAHRIRRVDTHGIFSTIAGTGAAITGAGAFAGDGGRAKNARLSSPTGIAFDSAGNLYIADFGNGKVRRVDGAGIISSLDTSAWPGSADLAPRALAFDSAGNLYVSSWYQWKSSGCWVLRITPQNAISVVAGIGTCGYGGDGGLATSATLDGVSGIAFDSAGNLYIADAANHRVRRVDTKGVITTVAGTGAMGTAGDGGLATRAELQIPLDLAVTSTGLLYIAEGGCMCKSGGNVPGRVLVLSLVDGTLQTLASSQTRILKPG
jgi:sugar lactone lactonase YvrE